MRPVSKIPQLAEQESSAETHYLTRSLIFIVPSGAHEYAKYVGSGVAVLTPDDNPVVLTAWHVAKDARDGICSFGYEYCTSAVEDFVAELIPHPSAEAHGADEVDVALIIPRPHAVPLLKSRAIGHVSIGRAEDVALDAADRCIACGTPAERVLNAEDRAVGKAAQFFGLLAYTCRFRGPNAMNLLEIDWRQGIVEPSHFQRSTPLGRSLEQKELELQGTVGEVTLLPNPKGMSGGPLWRFRATHEGGSLWTPATASRLVGIIRSWDQVRTLFVEPVSRWADWFREQLDAVDERVRKNG